MSTDTTTPPADGDPAAEAAEDDAQPDDKIGGEAARYRRRLRAAEAEAETAATAHAEQLTELETAHAAHVTELETAQAATSATLAAQRLAVVDLAIASARFDPEAFRPHLLTALGDDGLDGLLSDDGVLDIGKLTEAVKSTAAAFTPRHTGPRPNQQQGTPSQGGPAASWASVLGGRR
ncbi:hypothetical protein MN2019_17885 [Mycolicibacterium neoaurum]|uniref:hypothetical protein n=1 Tax=Mycolicibacterium neoaurum TaxID=1795 RepID=UPI001BCCEF68|nr:hypothetical protein [Mycolicibacterium neoaurum]QVI26173.1 hypothetical protein MN2019_17885 [Mycolicibacterium neoaurum]